MFGPSGQSRLQLPWHWHWTLQPSSYRASHSLKASSFTRHQWSCANLSAVTIPVVLHLAFPAFRVLLLIPLTIALYNPRIVYTPVHESADEIHTPVPTRDTTFLLAPEPIHASTGLNPVSGKYGTFGSSRSQIPASGPTTRATTPVGPSEQVSPSSSKKAKKEISHEPSWGEIGTRLKHLTPYLWPSGSRPLQLIGVRHLFSQLCAIY